MQYIDGNISSRQASEKKTEKTFSVISQKYSEQNTPKNIVQKPRYLTPMQLIKPNHSPRIHGSYHQNEQRDLNTQLLSKRLMKIYASSKLKEAVEVSINKRLSTDENKTLPYFDSIKQKTNNDYEYDYLY